MIDILDTKKSTEETEQVLDNNFEPFNLAKLLCESYDYIPKCKIPLQNYELQSSDVLDELELLIVSSVFNVEIQNLKDVEILERYGVTILRIKHLRSIPSVCEHIIEMRSCKFYLNNFLFEEYLNDVFISLLRLAHMNRIYKAVEDLKSYYTKVPETLKTFMIEKYKNQLKGILYMHKIILILYERLEYLQNNEDEFSDTVNVHLFETFGDVLQNNYKHAMKAYKKVKYSNIVIEQEPFTEFSKLYEKIVSAFVTHFFKWSKKTDIQYDISKDRYLWLLDMNNNHKHDLNNLRSAFEEFKFTVKITEGLTSKSLEEALNAVIEEFNKTKPCWFVMIVLGYDRTYPPISNILHCFTHEKCPSLSVQPKIFMFLNTSHDIIKIDWDYHPGRRNNLNLTDTLLLYNKKRGNQEQKENLTVNALCYNFKKYAQDYHIENVFKILSKNYSFVLENIAFKNCSYTTKFTMEVDK